MRVVLAVATILTILAVRVERTRPGAGLAVPSHLAGTLPGPRMTQLRIAILALTSLRIEFNLRSAGDIANIFENGRIQEAATHLRTIGTVPIVLAGSLVAIFTNPTRSAHTGAVDRIARGIVFTSALLRAV